MAERKRSTGDPPDSSIGVLICDDVAAMRQLLALIVELRPGLHVVGEAEDGDEVISAAERLQPDVILLDLSMPHRSGLEALPDLKRLAPRSKVIVLSGFASSAVADEVIARGAVRYVEKGVRPDELAAVIEEVGRQPARSG